MHGESLNAKFGYSGDGTADAFATPKAGDGGRVKPIQSLQEGSPVRSPVPSALVVKCAFTDMLLQKLAVSVVFFYPRPIDEQALRAGLEQALERIPLFAGRLHDAGDGLVLECDNSGVPWSTAAADLSLDEAIAVLAAEQAPWLLQEVEPARALTGRGPLFTVRLTRLKDGGSVLGLCWHHPIGDMHSFMLLMRAWSAAVEGRPLPEVLLVEDREAYLVRQVAPGGTTRPALRRVGAGELLRLIPYMAWTARRKTRVEVQFSEEEIDAMRGQLSAAAGQRLTSNDVVCGHVMELVIRLDDTQRSRILDIAVNYRSRVGLDPRLLGNLVAPMEIACDPGDDAARIAARIRHGVDHYLDEHLSLYASLKYIAEHGGAGQLGRCLPNAFDPLNRTMLVTNWSRFGVYDVSFGGQTPVYFTPVGGSPAPWAAWLVEGRGNRGLFLSIYLPRELAARLNSAEGKARLHRFRPT